jgi:mono/diheme cytochrome c family protein
MMPRLPRVREAWMVPLLLLAASTARAQEKGPTPEQVQFFETKVRPVLVTQCVRCHGPEKQRGGLRLDSRAAALQGGDKGPAVVPGKPHESRLVAAVNYQGLEMPPSKRLAKADVDTLTEWVRQGAPWPGGGTTTRRDGFEVSDADRAFWSFRPVARPNVPAVRDPFVANPIDAFVLEKLTAKELRPAPPADRRTLIRRVTFDLTGLPPSDEEVRAFVNDSRPDAYEKLVDRLLASPRYGERWGRHWLDVVRFAQTNGYERDDEKPFAWRYRDYVINSLNDDKPYDQFIKEQLAGDELDEVTDVGLTATAFYRLGVWDDEPDDKRQAEFDELDDMVSTTGQAFLGLTVGCARCHDHKFDPLGQDDYYGLLAFVRNVKPYTKPQPAGADVIFAKLSGEGFTLAVRENGPTAPPTQVLLRGNAANPGREVKPAFPLVLCRPGEAEPRLPEKSKNGQTTGRRRVLAEWVASKDNPLTARVIVNRLWQHHFGAGLAATPNDFGHTGTAPTHPELLDYLASELTDGGWRLKRMHKLIVMSATYRQSSRIDNDKGVAVDPGNALLWRQNLRRLEAEAVRDAVLATSGRLNPAMGGRGFFPTLPPEVLATQSRPGNGWGKSDEQEQCRRSVYVYGKRTLGVPMLEVFDQASADSSIAARSVTTVAPQALILLNGSFTDEQSAALADRLLKEGNDREKHLTRAFRLALQRDPTPRERDLLRAYLDRELARRKDAPPDEAYRRSLAAVCKLVLNLNEFVYVD